ncbi:SDR family oxidoreductase [Rhizobium sp. ICMP 5592]|uniref:SDR family oxidoreductase n=1 Tax=Rhizobium sp. ICMP 5592 TaxID=2292445 RepID=UPI00129634F3|nr:SDR family oxidoreductase [Rhizobium sp. ICMP 5592]MQB42666.1 NAD-dependent epimerase/dehydratase family protein [Rhizobium sp. ICMP 5592]
MKILILGATGFIGSVVAARLRADGHVVTGLARNPDRARIKHPSTTWIKADLATMTDPSAWLALLGAHQAVVNCAGALQDGLSDDLAATQERAMLALYAAASQSATELIVQISARTDGGGGEQPFLATKRGADEALAVSGLNHAILRPALVLGRNAHGGTALLRALAAMPFVLPLIHAQSPIETVSVDDVATTVSNAVTGQFPTDADIDLAGDDVLTLRDLVTLHRNWLGLPPARVMPIPAVLARPITWAADIAGRLGWRSPLRSTAMAVMSEGVLSRRDEQQRPGQPLAKAAEILDANPSGIQDLWSARLYLLKPLLITGLALFWMLSGIVPLLAPVEASRHFLPFISSSMATTLTIATCFLDIALGALVLARPFARAALYGMLGVTLAYLAGGTLLEPSLWLDPLGPLVKALPSILLTVATLAILEER